MKLEISLLKFRFFFALGLLVLITLGAFPVAHAQTAREPRKEQILNGLKLLIWSDPKTPKTTVKLRINAGAAFDPAGRAGTMLLLSDILFPDEGTKEFFAEDLGGSLNVEANYDYIQISAVGNNNEFLRILDTFKTAVISTPITPENFKKVRDARLKQAQEDAKTAAIVADSAVRKRLFGDFPYARPINGNPESLAKIEIGDLIVAKDRFLNADFSSLAIICNEKESYVLRAVRQLFGTWKKSDKPLLYTFRQPETPDSKILIVDSPDAEKAEIRFAVPGLARNDRDLFAAQIWAKALEEKLQNELGAVKVEQAPHILPGEFIIRASVPTDKTAQALNALLASLTKAANEKIEAKAFSDAQTDFLNALQTKLATPENAAEYWLDVETFKMPAANAYLNSVKSAASADAERVAAKLLKNPGFAVIIVGDAEKIQPQVDALGRKK